MDIAKKLKELREQKNLSKKQLTDKIDINYSTYNNYEAGTREPGAEQLVSLAKFHGVSVDYLLDSNEDLSIDVLLSMLAEKLGYELSEEKKNKILLAVKIAMEA